MNTHEGIQDIILTIPSLSREKNVNVILELNVSPNEDPVSPLSARPGSRDVCETCAALRNFSVPCIFYRKRGTRMRGRDVRPEYAS